ncbi:MAG: universal stress protein [Magnetospirillum sp.]
MGAMDIVVHLDDTPQAQTRLGVTAGLAAKMQARITAAAQIEPDQATLWPGQDSVVEWRRLGALRQFGAHIRHADMAVVGQPLDNGADHVTDFIMNGGRPVLVVPQYGRFDHAGGTILVAWNGSREATRAVYDALPLLACAERVVILTLDGHPSDQSVGENPGADIALVLARKGVRVELVHSTAGELDVGNALLSRCVEIGADLLVMGAFSRHPLRERALGGATHHILKHMTLPVLFSH